MLQGKGEEGYADINAALDAGAFAVLISDAPGVADDVRAPGCARRAVAAVC